MKKLALILPVLLLFSCSTKEEREEAATELVNALYITIEEAYYEGQRDALEGDVRIKLNNDSVYVWTKSPWDDGQEPIFKPGQEPIPIEL